MGKQDDTGGGPDAIDEGKGVSVIPPWATHWLDEGKLPFNAETYVVRSAAISGRWAALGRGSKVLGVIPFVVVEVFFRTWLGTWEHYQTLTSSADNPGEFGGAIALDGETLVIGAAPLGDEDTSVNGYVEVFGLEQQESGNGFVSTWVWQQTLEPPPPKCDPQDLPFTTSMMFGGAVHLAGDTLLVGAGRFDGGRGRAYLFQRQDGVWPTTPLIMRGDPDLTDVNFGQIVVHSGNTIAVAQRGGDTPNDVPPVPGRVCFFDLNGQTTYPDLLNSLGADNFAGCALALEGNTLVVGSVDGLVVFNNSNDAWIPSTTLTVTKPLDPSISAPPITVALAEGMLFVGSLTKAGTVNVYQSKIPGAWGHIQTLVDPAASGSAPTVVAVSGNSAVIASATTARVFSHSGGVDPRPPLPEFL